MARRTRSTSQPWAGKPAGKRKAQTGKPGKPAEAAVPEEPALPETAEACCEAIAAICQQVDELIPGPAQIGWGDPVQRMVTARLRPLIDHLDKLLNPPRPEPAAVDPDADPLTPEQEEEADSKLEDARRAWMDALQDPRDYLQVALSLDRGEVPSWSRPGTFLLWFGPLPVRCTWPGLFGDTFTLEPCQPDQLWFSVRGVSQHGLRFYKDMPPVKDVVASAMDRAISGRDSKGRLTASLMGLRQDEAMAVDDYLRSHRWLQEALRPGPVDVVPMPDELLLAQPPLEAF